MKTPQVPTLNPKPLSLAPKTNANTHRFTAEIYKNFVEGLGPRA